MIEVGTRATLLGEGVRRPHNPRPMSLRRRLLAANVALAGLLAIIFAVLLVAVISLRSASSAAEHSSSVIAAAEAAEKSILDLETGSRGFALTGQRSFLQPWTM